MEMVRITSVKPQPDYTLLLTFTNGKTGVYNAKPLLGRGPVFKPLNNPKVFNAVKVSHGTIEWPGEVDLCPDNVYAKTVFVN